MTTDSKDNQNNTPQTGISGLPSWVWIIGAILVAALGYTTVQMNDAQDGLAQANSEIAKTKKAMMTAEGAQAETAKKTASLKQAAARLEEEAAAHEKMTMSLKQEAAMHKAEADTQKKMAVSLKEKIAGMEKGMTGSNTRLGALQDELKSAGAKLAAAMAESEKHKMAAEAQAKMAQEYKANAERAAAQ